MSNQSDQINELACALCKAQSEMQSAIKDSVNPFYKNKYADLGSIWDAARPVLSKNGLCIIQTTEIIGDKTALITILAHSSGQWVKSQLPLTPSKNDNQGIGASITYLRRYSLSAILGVVTDEDDDGETSVGRGKTIMSQAAIPEPEIEPCLSKEQLKEIVILLGHTDSNFRTNFDAYMKSNWKVSTLNDIPCRQFNAAVTSIRRNIEMNKSKGS